MFEELKTTSLNQVVALLVMLGVTALLGCGGCTDRPAAEAKVQAGVTAANSSTERAAQDAGHVDYEELMQHRQILPSRINAEWFVVTGTVDKKNRYPSTVVVNENQLEPEESVRLCSGVLVSPRLVLTAGNCLCPRRNMPGGTGKFQFDGEACATVATVKTVTSVQPSGGAISASDTREYNGTVRTHPAFKMVLDDQGNVLSSEADLAVILLEEPVESDIFPVELAEIEIKSGELVMAVGYGYDKVTGSLERRFNESPVTRVLGSGGRIVFEQPQKHGFKGARGGPCLRDTATGAVLVGVLSRGMGREASFTSTYPYRAWLREEILRAEGPGQAAPRGVP